MASARSMVSGGISPFEIKAARFLGDALTEVDDIIASGADKVQSGARLLRRLQLEIMYEAPNVSSQVHGFLELLNSRYVVQFYFEQGVPVVMIPLESSDGRCLETLTIVCKENGLVGILPPQGIVSNDALLVIAEINKLWRQNLGTHSWGSQVGTPAFFPSTDQALAA